MLNPTEASFAAIDEVSAVDAGPPLSHHPDNSAPRLQGLGRDAADDAIGQGALSDPVAHYFKRIGRFDLLTREDEAELAKQIEAGEQEILRAILQSTIAVDYLINLGCRIENGTQAAGRILMHIHRRGEPISLRNKMDLLLTTGRRLAILQAAAKTGRRELAAGGLKPGENRRLTENLKRLGGQMFNLLKT